MQLTVFSVAVFTGLALAQFQGLPTCAVSLTIPWTSASY